MTQWENEILGKVTLDNITDVVCEALGKNGEITDRQREIMTSLITHLHAFCKDVKLQHNEFIEGCEFLRRAGAGGECSRRIRQAAATARWGVVGAGADRVRNQSET